MDELVEFGTLVLVVSAGFLIALFARKLSERFPIPAPALFLVAAAIAPAILSDIRTVERIGVVGTALTAGVMAVLAHYIFGFDWTTAGILGAALAPTDPAVMFSILGNKQIAGRTGIILEGESGVNDPVGIALMIGMLEFATSDEASAWGVAGEFALEMSVGLLVGIGGAALLIPFMRRVSLPSEGLYPLRALAAAGVLYGLASVAHGSGFLAVFIAGLALGDLEVPYKVEIRRFHASLAGLAEIVMFVALGLTVNFADLREDGVWLDGLLLALLLALVARPIIV